MLCSRSRPSHYATLGKREDGTYEAPVGMQLRNTWLLSNVALWFPCLNLVAFLLGVSALRPSAWRVQRVAYLYFVLSFIGAVGGALVVRLSVCLTSTWFSHKLLTLVGSGLGLMMGSFYPNLLLHFFLIQKVKAFETALDEQSLNLLAILEKILKGEVLVQLAFPCLLMPVFFLDFGAMPVVAAWGCLIIAVVDGLFSVTAAVLYALPVYGLLRSLRKTNSSKMVGLQQLRSSAIVNFVGCIFSIFTTSAVCCARFDLPWINNIASSAQLRMLDGDELFVRRFHVQWHRNDLAVRLVQMGLFRWWHDQEDRLRNCAGIFKSEICGAPRPFVRRGRGKL